jgi:nicotinate-nucleotide adenylyltransferase
MRRIALLGGAFSPITEGHINITDIIINNTNVEEIWLVPCYNHRQKDVNISPENRIAMCNVAIQTIPYVQVCRYEIDHKLDGSAFNCISELKKLWGNEIEFSYVIGMDNVVKFDTWYRSEELKKLVNFIVLPRVGLKNSLDDWYQKDPHSFLNINPIEVSSTVVRGLLKKWWVDPKPVEEELHRLMNIRVLDYIRSNGLYI